MKYLWICNILIAFVISMTETDYFPNENLNNRSLWFAHRRVNKNQGSPAYFDSFSQLVNEA